MTEERAFQLIAESFETLKKEGMLAADVALREETILLGVGSPVDSIGFVTFVTELEERLIEETNKDLYLVLNEINEFNVDKPHLTADVLKNYLVKLSEGAAK
jgi:hypothetical protein